MLPWLISSWLRWVRTACVTLGLLLASLNSSASSTHNAVMADAAERSDATELRRLLRSRASLDAGQADGMTALHWLIRHEDVAAARSLLKAGASPNITNLYGVTPLSIACVQGHLASIELLLSFGADVNQTLRGGEMPLMTAARTGKVAPVQALLDHGARIDAKERRGQTALMWAAAEGHAGVVAALLKAGADYRITLPNSGFNALLFAVRQGRMEATRVLLKAGAPVSEAMQPQKPSGKGPRKGTSALLLAVENGHFELASLLLDAGADPNDQRSGFAALHALTWVRKANRGDGDDGDPEPMGSGSMTSLQFVRKLVQSGANVNLRLISGNSGRGILTRKGATPFLLAAVTADIAYMRLLVELGADPLIPNETASTPLMAACGVGSLAPEEEAGTEAEALEAVEFCLAHGAKVEALDLNGETAMHGAAYKSFPKVVELLAAKGLRIDTWNHKNKWGWSPYDIASGHRVGNFNPSAATQVAIGRVMKASGVLVPDTESRTTEVLPVTEYPASTPPPPKRP